MSTQHLIAIAGSARCGWADAGRHISASVIVTITVLASGPALAVNTIWTGPATGGVFNDDANWSNLAPGNTASNDVGIFNSSTNVDGTITFDADVQHGSVFVQNTAGTISFDTGSHKWTTTGSFLVGAADAPNFPKVRHIGGEIEFHYVLLGTQMTGPNPSFELTGSNTHLHTTRGSGGYQIGLQSSGATMLVHNGAQMTADGQVIIGLVGSSNSKLTIDGVGSQLVSGNYLGVGHSGEQFGPNATGSRAEIINGATATASHVFMAITPGATDNTLLVSGSGSKLTLAGVNGNDGSVTAIGRQGSDNLFQIEEGAVVDGNNRILLGMESSSTNNQILIDDGSLAGTSLEINQGNVTVTDGAVDLVQYFNEGDEIFEGGGIVAANGAASSFTFNSGTVAGVNANIDNGSALVVGDGGANAATYSMKLDVDGNNGIHSFADGLSLSSNGILSGNGNIVGNVSGTAGANVEVGVSIGRIQVDGAWDNSGIDIALELGDLSASAIPGEQFDQLDITGAFTHGGAVTIDLSEYLPPSSAEQLKVLGWDSDSGESGDTTVSFVDGGALPFEFLSDGLYVSTEAAGLAGDYNADGVVDAADYTVWRDLLGASQPLANRDPGADGAIGQSDYEFWKMNFGAGATAGTSSQAMIPEPEAWAYWMGLVMGGMLLYRRGRRGWWVP